jgi:Peptidase family M48
MREFKLVNDPALDSHLQDIADRMSTLSNAGKVRVELFDIPDVNAFTMAGGRILVSRKLVAYARSEDELAGVLAHEFGHILSHDPECGTSMVFRKVLNVNSVGDRRDIEDKYNRLIENGLRKKIKGVHFESEAEQQIADRYAVWLMARAGYDPQAFTQFWDRLAELRSHTGSWLSDLFGTTKPDAKRLRIALRAVGALPAACISKTTVTDAQFKAWQQSVVEASRAARTAKLHNVVSERKLDPALRTDLSQMRFSPDGKWIMAQDDASVFVFSRDPLAFKFRIDAPDAHPAEFSPDSSSIVFYDTDFRVERWNVADQKREWVHEIAPQKPCMNTALSRDGLYLACATSDFELRIWEVATNNVVFEKRNIYTPKMYDAFLMLLAILNNLESGEIPFFNLRFSPDGHYLVCARNDGYVAVDMTRKATISLPGSIKERIGRSFAFIGNDRIVGVNPFHQSDSAIVAFPSGQLISKVNLGGGQLQGASHGNDRFIVRPIVRYPLGVYDVKQNKLTMGNKVPGFDIYDDYYVSERRDGEIGIYKFGEQNPLQSVQVPTGPLGRLRAADVSDDFNLLAISQRSRGAMWDMKTGERKAFVRGFRGAYVAKDETTFLDFPEYENTSRIMVQVDAAQKNFETLLAFGDVKKDLSNFEGRPDNSATVKTRIADNSVVQFGAYLVGWRERTKGDDRELVVRDGREGKELWSRKFGKSSPWHLYGDSHAQWLTLQWSADEPGARKIMDANPALKAQFQSMKSNKGTVELLEVVDLTSGATTGAVLVDTGGNSFRIRTVDAAKDTVVIGDSRNRTLAYSLSTGKQLGHAFGTPVRLSKDGSVLLVENGAGQAILYSLPTMEKKDDLSFPSGVAFARFGDDAKRLFILTKDHTAYTLSLNTNEVAAK